MAKFILRLDLSFQVVEDTDPTPDDTAADPAGYVLELETEFDSTELDAAPDPEVYLLDLAERVLSGASLRATEAASRGLSEEQ